MAILRRAFGNQTVRNVGVKPWQQLMPSPPRWNTWATIHPAQWDWEKQPKERQVRLAAAVPQAGDPVRVRTPYQPGRLYESR